VALGTLIALKRLLASYKTSIGSLKMTQEKQIQYNYNVLICNQLTIAETLKGKNGRPLFDAWDHAPEDYDDSSRGDIKRAYRLGDGF